MISGYPIQKTSLLGGATYSYKLKYLPFTSQYGIQLNNPPSGETNIGLQSFCLKYMSCSTTTFWVRSSSITNCRGLDIGFIGIQSKSLTYWMKWHIFLISPNIFLLLDNVGHNSTSIVFFKKIHSTLSYALLKSSYRATKPQFFLPLLYLTLWRHL